MPDYITVGNFKVDRNKLLSRGNFGNVYLAQDLKEKGNATVAAREVWMGNDTDDIAHIKREVERIGKIPYHPNILRLIGHKINSSDLWIFTQYCTMGNLDNLCEKTSLSDTECLDLMIQMTRAVYHLHHLLPLVVHGDIKPGKILLTVRGRTVLAKLSVFGESNFANPAVRLENFTGKEEFWPPEMFKLKKHKGKTYTLAADIFSLGLLIHDLMVADRRRLQGIRGNSC